MTDFLSEMDQLAAEIAKAAREAATGLDIKIDAFKALVPYYVQKMKRKDGEPEDDGLPDFNSFQSQIHSARTPTAENSNGADQSGVRGN